MSKPRSTRRAQAVQRSGIAALTAFLLHAGPAAAHDLIIAYDQSQLWRLSRPVAEIIIGNATIADVSVRSSDLLVVTGKSFGVTNIIALDAERNVVETRRVIVERDERQMVTLHKGGKRESYNCSSQCNPTITVGDDPHFFETIAKLSERKMQLSEGKAAGNKESGN